MTTELPTHVVCFRVENAPVRPCIGSKRRWCGKCQKAVSASPVSLEWIKKGVAVLCWDCWEKEVKPEDKIITTPEQLKEIAENLRTRP